MSDFDIARMRVAGFDEEVDAQLIALEALITEERFPPLQDYRDLRPGEPSESTHHGPEHTRRYLHLARPRYNVIAQWLAPLRGAQGADVGASYGFLDLLLAERYGMRVIPIEHPDNIPAYSGLLRDRGIEVRPWLIGRSACPLPAESLEFVIFAEVLEHLKLPPLRTLAEVTAPLKRGGTLALTTPNVGRQANIRRLRHGKNIFEPYREDLPPGRDPTDFVTHVREYTIQEVVDLVEAAGLRVEDLACCNWMDERLGENPLRNRYTCVLATKV